MINSSSSREASYHFYAVISDKSFIDLRDGILMLSHDHRIIILPQHKVAVAPVQTVKYILLQCQIKIWITAGTFDIVHHMSVLLPSASVFHSAAGYRAERQVWSFGICKDLCLSYAGYDIYHFPRREHDKYKYVLPAECS